jgi:hypothetical protein
MTDGVPIHVDAREFIDPQGSIVESARLLGLQVQQVVKSRQQPVEISLLGMKGLSSSYFNLLLRMLIEVTGVDQVRDRVRWRFDSPLQKSVFERSWSVISKEAA